MTASKFKSHCPTANPIMKMSMNNPRIHTSRPVGLLSGALVSMRPSIGSQNQEAFYYMSGSTWRDAACNVACPETGDPAATLIRGRGRACRAPNQWEEGCPGCQEHGTRDQLDRNRGCVVGNPSDGSRLASSSAIANPRRRREGSSVTKPRLRRA